MVAPANLPAVHLTTWTVSASEGCSHTLQAENWLTALGRALETLRIPPCAGRLAAEMLPNGVVIANDLSSGRRFVVQRA